MVLGISVFEIIFWLHSERTQRNELSMVLKDCQIELDNINEFLNRLFSAEALCTYVRSDEKVTC